jgi:hypothetical protein
MGTNYLAEGAAERPPSFVRIPLRSRAGEVRAHALVDEADAHLIDGHRWFLADGYAVRSAPPVPGRKFQRRVSMARTILGLEEGDPREVDHIVSEHKLDNRRSNLRVVTHAQNAQNRKRTDGVSKHRGVSYRKNRKSRPWVAYGCKEGKQVHLGFFDREEDAAAAAVAWRRENLPYAME